MKILIVKTLTHVNCVNCICFNYDGSKIVSGTNDQNISIWDIETGLCLRLIYTPGRVNSVFFNYDGSKIVSGCNDGVVSVWDSKTGECLKVLRGHSSEITSVIFIPEFRNNAILK